ncbi:hypothetical protein ATKI12_2481 [Kitasatospora sp. Ki12]
MTASPVQANPPDRWTGRSPGHSGLSVTVLTQDGQAPGERLPSHGDNLPDGRDARVD